MDAKTFSESIEYERLTQAVYQAIMRRDGLNIAVEHNVDVAGRSGVEHQIDVLWRFELAGVRHFVLIECKNYHSALTLEKVRNFFSVLHDIGNCNGVMVTLTGYQSGVVRFAEYYGIGLKLLRRPTTEDWDGKIKDIVVNLKVRGIVSTDEKPVVTRVKLAARDQEEKNLLLKLQEQGRLAVETAPDTVFYDSDRNVITPELRWWLPRQLDISKTPEGGPYSHRIDLECYYLLINAGERDEVLVLVDYIEVDYHVETIDNRQIILLGEQLVEAVLKDFSTNTTEHVHRKTS